MKRKGFTLMELLIVIGIIAILAAIVIIAINPARQLALSRNAQRESNVNTILNAVHQQALDNKGVVLAAIPGCDTPGNVGTGDVNLTALTPTYLAAIPTDPTDGTDADTKYTICKTAENRVTVAAPNASEVAGVTISVTR